MPGHIDPDTKMCNCAVCHCELVGITSDSCPHGRKLVAGHRIIATDTGGTHAQPLCRRCAKLEKAKKTRTPNVGSGTS